jgi:hypothetical protein
MVLYSSIELLNFGSLDQKTNVMEINGQAITPDTTCVCACPGPERNSVGFAR